MEITKLHVYQRAMLLGDEVWNLTGSWNRYAKETLGKQLNRAVDSIAANISEGYGRYHFKENRNFCYYARGSLFEAITWLQKAGSRGLIPKDECAALLEAFITLRRMLNKYIASIGKSGHSPPDPHDS